MTDVYKLDLRQTDAFAQANTTRERLLATLETNDAATMAATLRAVADRLDPPKLAQPVYRDGGRTRSALDAVALNAYRCRGDACNEGHTYGYGCLRVARSQDVPVAPVEVDAARRVARRNLVTPDGCGPEHTFTGSCHLAVQGRID